MSADPLTRWRTRCERAIATGEGLPTTGYLWWKRTRTGYRGELCRLVERIRFEPGTVPWTAVSCLSEHLRGAQNDTQLWVRAIALSWLREELAKEDT